MNKCMICNHETQEGIVIQKKYLCLHCEQMVVTIEVNHPFYPFVVEKLKGIQAD